MNKRSWLFIVILTCLAGLLYVVLGEEPARRPPPLPTAGLGRDLPPGHPQVPGRGDKKMAAPDFALESLNRGRIRLSELKGKVVLINFWSAGCGPCLIEMPSFEKLYKSMAGKPFEILAVTPDPRHITERVAKELNLTIPLLNDPEGEAAGKYGVIYTPETFIIAPDGTVDNRVLGAANWADGSVVDYLNKLIQASGKGQAQ